MAIAKKGKVLCVDDEPNIVRALQWLLQKEFDVLTANSAQDGLALVRQNDFDVVISDQRMPQMTGVEFLQQVKQLSPRSMRILLTGYSDMQAILKSVNESEVFRFINKPWNIAELPKVVEQAAGLSRLQAGDEIKITEESPLNATPDQTVLLIDDNPESLQALRDQMGGAVGVHHAQNIAQAVQALNESQVSVIVSDTKVGSTDVTRLIRMLKQQHPEIVTVVFTEETDAETVTSLINQGQIFRFIPKPIKPGYLKLVVNSALAKHNQLKQNPDLLKRHEVQATAAGTLDALLADVEKAAPAGSAVADSSGKSGLMSWFSSGVKRLFGR